MTARRRYLSALIDVLLCLVFPGHWLRRRPLAGLKPQRILVCRTDHIGDVYLSLPALALVRAHYPEARLTVLTASWAAPVLHAAAYHDELLICDPPWWVYKRRQRFGTPGGSTWRALWQTIKQLRQRRFDLCIDLRGDVREIVAFGVLGGARHLLTRRRNGGGALADIAVTIDEGIHESDQNLLVIRALGIDTTGAAFTVPHGAEEAGRVVQVLTSLGGQAGRTVMVHPGAKHVNRWPAHAYAELIAELGKNPGGIRIVLTGTDGEAALCADIARALPGQAHVLAGKMSLTETAALMAAVDLVIMADTGPMHFLNAMTTQALLIFGATPAARFAPRGAHIKVISAANCCLPTLHDRCTRAPAEAPSACMMGIAVAEVTACAQQLLARQSQVAGKPTATASAHRGL